MSSSYQPRSNQRPEDQESDVNIAELVGTAALAGVGLGGIAGLALKRKANTAKSTQQINEFLSKARQQRKSPGATSGVKQADLSNVDVTPSKTPTRMKEVYQEAAQPVEINKTPQLTGSTSVARPNTFVDDYTREITERRLGEQQVEDALQVLNLTRESRSERARQAANVRRVQAAAADDIIDELRSQRTVDQTATAINSGAGQQIGRTKHRLQSNEDVVLRKVEQSEDLVDAAVQKQVQQQNIPLEDTPKRDAAIDLVSSDLPDGTPVDQAEIVATGQGSVQRKQVLENAGLPSGSSSVSDLSITNVANNSTLSQADIDAMNKVGITGVKSAGVRTSLQDDDLRRKEFTPQQVERVKNTVRVEKPSSQEFVNEQLEQRLNKLQQETTELKARQETLSRASALMAQGLQPGTTRFDNALAAGMVGKSGLIPRVGRFNEKGDLIRSSAADRALGVTDPEFQENVVLSQSLEEALPPTQRLFYEQTSEGQIIPETVEKRQERPVRITQEDTKTLKSAGGRIGSTAASKTVIGPYGIEREDFPKADITKRPTDTGGKKSFSTQPPAAGDPKESMTMAEEVRKIYNNPNISPEKRAAAAQDFLSSKMGELNISAIGDSKPLRKNPYGGRRRRLR